MASTRIQTLLREVDVVVKDIRSGKTARQQFVSAARAEIAKAESMNRQTTGGVVPYRVAVDGKIGAPMESVKEGGTIAAHFDLVTGMLTWIGEMLVKESPVRTGRYANSHVIFADGVEVKVGEKVPEAEVYVFSNYQPYARKIERGLSKQAPDGVYQAVGAVARRRYSNLATIKFTYQSIQDDGLADYVHVGRESTQEERKAHATERVTRQPALVVTIR